MPGGVGGGGGVLVGALFLALCGCESQGDGSGSRSRGLASKDAAFQVALDGAAMGKLADVLGKGRISGAE